MNELSVDEIIAERERLREEFLRNQQQKAIEANDWDTIIISTPRGELLEVFFDMQDDIPDDQFVETFISVYQSVEFEFESIPKSILLKVKQLNQTKYDAIKKLTVYRGIGSESMEYGYSWTTDIAVAKKFATHRSAEDGELLTCEVDGDAIVYMDIDGGERNESEVIVLPSMLDIEGIQRTPVINPRRK